MERTNGSVEKAKQPRLWHYASGEEVLVSLQSSDREGLASAEAARRLARFGTNSLPDQRRRATIVVFARQFKSPLIYLLFIAAAIAFLIGERGDAAVILFVVTVNALIGAIQEGRAERSMKTLRRLSGFKARVLRDGVEQLLEARSLVPGDVLLLGAGDAVTADARILDALALEVAEAALTGESVPIQKHADPTPQNVPLADRRSMVYAGTYITSGRGRAVVVATGCDSEVGRIAALTQAAEEPKTPLERRVDQFGRYLVLAALGVFAVVFATGLLRGIPVPEILMVAISQLVSIVPEGLPVAMTIALAVGMQRMAARKTIVRRLGAIEALGSTTVICSDKTGTLTQNEMMVSSVYLPSGADLVVSGAGYSPDGHFLEDGVEVRPQERPELMALLAAGALCNDAQLAPPDQGGDCWRGLGDPTEVALIVLAQKGGVAFAQLRNKKPRRAELPFSADTKMMATVHNGEVFIKGAPEVVLALCGFTLEKCERKPLDVAARARLHQQVEQMAQKALRVLAVAQVEHFDDGLVSFEQLQGRAVLLGLVGQWDPPREEALKAVRECHRAGIRTVMVTGDHVATGLAVARFLEIARDGDSAVEGRELERMEAAEFQRKLHTVSVFARVHPAQKLKIVEGFQRAGEVVAMTGDGVNDAPALALADVGVAMGITGTEVAKEASKIVIADDNFATIVRAVEAGRVVYRNIKKVTLLLISTGIAEVMVLVGGLLAGLPLPFNAVQILWNNVVTEGTITVNLVMEPSEGDEMLRPPIPRGEPILTRSMIGRLAVMGLTITVCCLGFYAYRLSQGVAFEQARTATFTLLVVCEWFNVLNCRSESKSALSLSIFKNPWLVGGLLLSNALQFAVVFVPLFNRTFHTVPIPLSEVLAIGAVGSVVLWAEEARKFLARRALSRPLGNAPRLLL
jgi:magnesium-transporting ATPase (P-type)